VSSGGTSERDTDAGTVTLITVAADAFRIGWSPDPFAWTPWQYAELGRFDGRWDDPEGTYRTLYLGDSLLSVLLEVLARFRVDLALLDELADIADNDDSDSEYPTARAGTVPRSWLTRRRAGMAPLRGESVDVRRPATVAALRRRFGRLAGDLGLPDLDASALKATAPGQLTQIISGWTYRTLRPPVSGIAFGSRHGDDLTMWAIFEEPGEAETGSATPHNPVTFELNEQMPDLIDAMRLHGLSW
jgi:hypothetical protein